MNIKIFCRCSFVSFLVGLRTYQHFCITDSGSVGGNQRKNCSGYLILYVIYEKDLYICLPIIWESPYIFLTKAGFVCLHVTEIVISRQSAASVSTIELINLPGFFLPTLNHLQTDRPKRTVHELTLHCKEQLKNEAAFQFYV